MRLVKKLVIDFKPLIHLIEKRHPSDRLGRLAELWMKDIPNREYAIYQGVRVFQRAILPLAETFDYFNKSMTNLVGETGEQCDCWVNESYMHENDIVVWVNHKYWSFNQIRAFFHHLLIMAKLFEWNVEVYDSDAVIGVDVALERMKLGEWPILQFPLEATQHR